MTRAKAQSAPSFEKQENIFSLRSWRPFGEAQDRIAAKKFLEVALSNISNGGIA
jgi:hypothetical protein